MGPQRAAIVNSVAGDEKAPLVIARSRASRRFSAPTGSGNASANCASAEPSSVWSMTQFTVLRRLTDHAQAGVRGDSDVGEPQNQGGRLGVRHGHVAQVAPAAVTSRPYRSRASVR